MTQLISPDYVGFGTDKLTVNFTNTKTNEAVNIDNYTGYVMDIDGKVYQQTAQGSEKTLTLVGGDGTGAGYGKPMVDDTYLTRPQKASLYKVLKSMSVYRDDCTFESKNESLQLMIESTYRNYSG